MMNELKRCPFCGGRPSIRAVTPVHEANVKVYGYGGYYVMCEDCLTTSNNYNTPERAAEMWNRDILHNALSDDYFDREIFERLQKRVLEVLVPAMKVQKEPEHD